MYYCWKNCYTIRSEDPRLGARSVLIVKMMFCLLNTLRLALSWLALLYLNLLYMYSVWQIMINNMCTIQKEFRFLLFNLGN